MGGGDLNSKKSWHPNTMKNQERVWKAEQAAAEEKKRIVELQRERAEERDRTELNNLMTKRNSVSTGNESHLAWMYNKPDKNIQDEEYLLGKSIDRNAEQSQKVEQDAIPAVSRRVVGSSMLATGGDTQVDLARKVREDPLLLIKERERAARAALLNNPLQRRRLTELLRKEKDQKEEKKIKKKAKKKDKDVDKMLAAKLSALRGEKGLNLAALLDSNDSFDSSSEDQSKKKKKKRKKEKVKKSKKLKKKKKNSSSSDSDGEIKKETEINKKKYKSSPHESSQGASESRKRRYFDTKDSDDIKTKRPSGVCHSKFNDEYVRERYNDKRNESKEHQFRRSSPRDNSKSASERDSRRPVGLTEEEKAAKLAEMATAGAERELQRGRRVAEQRAADAAADKSLQSARGSMKNEARCLPDSLQSRIHSNRHYIQRDKRHMNEHFARR